MTERSRNITSSIRESRLCLYDIVRSSSGGARTPAVVKEVGIACLYTALNPLSHQAPAFKSVSDHFINQI